MKRSNTQAVSAFVIPTHKSSTEGGLSTQMIDENYVDAMKQQRFGVELEMTGITRNEAKRVVKDFFQDEDMFDKQGREWSIKLDSSIVAKVKINNVLMPANDEYKVELVSPILGYADLPILQELVRTLRRSGAIDSEQTGLHVHIDDSDHTKDTLRNLIKIMGSKEPLLIKSLEIPNDRLYHYCNTVTEELINIVDRRKFRDMRVFMATLIRFLFGFLKYLV